MFDNLREPADSDPFDASSFQEGGAFDSTPFYEEEERFREAEEAKPVAPKKQKRVKKAAPASGHFLGMTPAQRFALALMLFITVCVVGSMLLVITGKVGLI
jgi:hypothetical protein